MVLRGGACSGLPALPATSSGALVHTGGMRPAWGPWVLTCSQSAGRAWQGAGLLDCWGSGCWGAVETSPLAACAEPQGLPAPIAGGVGAGYTDAPHPQSPSCRGLAGDREPSNTHGVTSPNNPRKGVLLKLLVLSPFPLLENGWGGCEGWLKHRLAETPGPAR